MLPGINGGSDLPFDYMEKIYHRIVNDEIKMMDTESATFYSNAGNAQRSLPKITNNDKELKGYLVKQGGRIKTWKKRWFVLSDNCIYYFKSHEVLPFIGNAKY